VAHLELDRVRLAYPRVTDQSGTIAGVKVVAQTALPATTGGPSRGATGATRAKPKPPAPSRRPRAKQAKQSED
jgi:hypothetical protein